MAKKDPTDLTVEEKLKALYQLQTTLSAIDEKRALRGELPLEVQDLEDDIAGLTTRIEKIQTDIEQFDRAINQKQHEIEDAQASVERYKKQLEMVSNNREYDTLSKEIEFQELEIELCSKKIREAQQMINERLYDLHKAEDQKADREKGLVMKRSELESIMAETREEEENLKEKAFELEKKIEPRLLQSFKRIRNGARNGLGIVYVHGVEAYHAAVEQLVARAQAVRPAPIKEQMAEAAKQAGKENAARPAPAKAKEARNDR